MHEQLYEQTCFQLDDYHESTQLQPNSDEIKVVCEGEIEKMSHAIKENKEALDKVSVKAKNLKVKIDEIETEKKALENGLVNIHKECIQIKEQIN